MHDFTSWSGISVVVMLESGGDVKMQFTQAKVEGG